jgi:hypothetical protein
MRLKRCEQPRPLLGSGLGGGWPARVVFQSCVRRATDLQEEGDGWRVTVLFHVACGLLCCTYCTVQYVHTYLARFLLPVLGAVRLVHGWMDTLQHVRYIHHVCEAVTEPPATASPARSASSGIVVMLNKGCCTDISGPDFCH